MGKNEDILANLDILENQENIDVLEENTLPENHAEGYEIIEEIIESHEEIHEDVLDTQETTEEHLSVSKKISDSFIFIIKYISTSICIFGVLLVVSNYSAYWNVVHSIIYAEEMEHTKKSLIESVAAASVSEKQHEEQEVDTFK
jgi:hypothetical protein